MNIKRTFTQISKRVRLAVRPLQFIGLPRGCSPKNELRLRMERLHLMAMAAERLLDEAVSVRIDIENEMEEIDSLLDAGAVNKKTENTVVKFMDAVHDYVATAGLQPSHDEPVYQRMPYEKAINVVVKNK